MIVIWSISRRQNLDLMNFASNFLQPLEVLFVLLYLHLTQQSPETGFLVVAGPGDYDCDDARELVCYSLRASRSLTEVVQTQIRIWVVDRKPTQLRLSQILSCLGQGLSQVLGWFWPGIKSCCLCLLLSRLWIVLLALLSSQSCALEMNFVFCYTNLFSGHLQPFFALLLGVLICSLVV